MKKITKLFLPVLAFLTPSQNTFASIQKNMQQTKSEDIKIEAVTKDEKKYPALYKFFLNSKISQFVRHSSHSSHSSHQSHASHTSGSYGSSSKSYSSDNEYGVPDHNESVDSSVYPNEEYAYAEIDLNVRSNASSESEIVTSITKGTKVKILSKELYPWYRISVTGFEGYVNAKYLKYNQ